MRKKRKAGRLHLKLLKQNLKFLSNRIRAEVEINRKTRILNMRDAELLASKEEINRLEIEFSVYKVRAHSLLQKKDAELAATRDSEQLNALEEAPKEVQNDILRVTPDRDRVLQDFQYAMASHEKEFRERQSSRKC